jgi:hypothetical protein
VDFGNWRSLWNFLNGGRRSEMVGRIMLSYGGEIEFSCAWVR